MGLRQIVLSGLIVVGYSMEGHAQEAWAGWYGGLSIDAVRAESGVGSNTVHQYKDQTANLGAFAGYNIVRNSGFVWGPELTITSVSTEGVATGAGLGGSVFSGGVLVNPRLRAGFATDRVFYYGILGLGISDVGARPDGETGNDLVVTPSIGLGVAFATGDGWATKIEATHQTYDSPEYDFNGTSLRSDTKLTRITLGLSRKF